jgi:hypothetical protein
MLSSLVTRPGILGTESVGDPLGGSIRACGQRPAGAFGGAKVSTDSAQGQETTENNQREPDN